MSETTKRPEREGLFEMGAAAVGTATRLGLTVSSVPLVLLPRNARRRVRRAMVEVARAVVVLPKELTAVSERVVDDIFNGTEPTFQMPNIDRIGERARSFTERLGRAADEFGVSLGRAAERAADDVERNAGRVDEWVEKPPEAPKV
ncbi:MAG: hypothetical protein HC822_06255 [Oscillochloris sp.]|nr:hypothetical protein [Oscillochloris sp.]